MGRQPVSFPCRITPRSKAAEQLVLNSVLMEWCIICISRLRVLCTPNLSVICMCGCSMPDKVNNSVAFSVHTGAHDPRLTAPNLRSQNCPQPRSSWRGVSKGRSWSSEEPIWKFWTAEPFSPRLPFLDMFFRQIKPEIEIGWQVFYIHMPSKLSVCLNKKRNHTPYMWYVKRSRRFIYLFTSRLGRGRVW